MSELAVIGSEGLKLGGKKTVGELTTEEARQYFINQVRLLSPFLHSSFPPFLSSSSLPLLLSSLPFLH